MANQDEEEISNPQSEESNRAEGSKDESYQIDTAIIFMKEYAFWHYHEHQHWKKYPTEISESLQSALQRIIGEKTEPSIRSSPENLPDLQLKFKEFIDKVHDEVPFALDYFMSAYNKPIEEYKVRRLHWGGIGFYYLFYYDQSVIINRQEQDVWFELLFAFSLRQCNLTDMDDFLSYHLEKNFERDIRQFIKFLKVIKRKYHQTLFTDETTESVIDWINEAEKAPQQKVKKIETTLTVDALAYLFKALVENNLISRKNNSQLTAFISQSFETKAQKKISKKSLYNKFHSPRENVIEFWVREFDNLHKFAIREQQKNKA